MENKARREGVIDISEGVREPRRDRFRKFKSTREPISREFGNVVAIVYANETHFGRTLYKVEVVLPTR